MLLLDTKVERGLQPFDDERIDFELLCVFTDALDDEE